MLRCVLPSRVLPVWGTLCAELVVPTSPAVRHGPRSPACKTKTTATALQSQVDSLRRDAVSAVAWSAPRICTPSRLLMLRSTAVLSSVCLFPIFLFFNHKDVEPLPIVGDKAVVKFLLEDGENKTLFCAASVFQGVALGFIATLQPFLSIYEIQRNSVSTMIFAGYIGYYLGIQKSWKYIMKRQFRSFFLFTCLPTMVMISLIFTFAELDLSYIFVGLCYFCFQYLSANLDVVTMEYFQSGYANMNRSYFGDLMRLVANCSATTLGMLSTLIISSEIDFAPVFSFELFMVVGSVACLVITKMKFDLPEEEPYMFFV